MSAILKQSLLSAVAEIERLDPQSLVAARCRGVLDAIGSPSGKRGRKLVRPELETPIAEGYLAGQSVMQIAAALGIEQGNVARSLRRQGIALRSNSQAPNRTSVAAQERLDRIREARANGKTLDEIGTAEGLTRERIRQICAKNGIDTVSRPLTPTEQLAADAYANGDSLDRAAEILGRSVHSMSRVLAQAGVAVRPSRRQRCRMPGTLAAAERAAAMYQSGVSTADIGRALDLAHPSQTYRLLAIAGIKPNRQRPTPALNSSGAMV